VTGEQPGTRAVEAAEEVEPAREVVASVQLDLDGEEPAVLGAAATVPLERGDRRRRRTKTVWRKPPSAAANGATAGYSVEYVFEPGSATRVPLGEYLRSLWERRAFVTEMADAEVRGPQAGTVLGRLWGLLDPLFQVGIYYFLFVVVRGGAGRPIEFLPLLAGGVFLFGLTTGAIGEGGRSIRRSRNLMLNSSFPRALLPLVEVWRGILAFAPSSFVIVLAVFLWGQPSWWLLTLPALFVVQTVLDVGLALAISTLVVFFEDVSNVLRYVTRVLFFATPVIYPVDLLPEGARTVVGFNPLFPLFATYQHVIEGRAPDGALVVQAVLWAIFFVVVGMYFFRRHEHEFASHL
jgi:ABC-type polysaccharide/polyol phosphate export permease